MNQDNKKEILEILKRKNIDIVKLLGIITIIILDKDFFAHNADVGSFLEKVMEIKLPVYVIKSRTLMAARSGKIIINYNLNEQIELKDKIYEYLKEADLKEEKLQLVSKKRNKKKNENEKLEKWLRRL